MRPQKIIIPMAGQSRRFAAAGYDTAKPFISLDGIPMIERVCRTFAPSDEFIFVCNREHLRDKRCLEILKHCARHYRIVEIEAHEKGPLYSALAAEPCLKAADPVIVTYCDFTVRWNYKKFLEKAAMHDGALAVFRGFHPASFGRTNYCYVRVDAQGAMSGLREKRPYTDNRSDEYASTGTYYVDSWKTFKDYASRVLESGESVGSEYYVSLIYPPMVCDGKSVCTFEVEKFICWGTPEDVREYLFWSRYFANVGRKP